MAETQFGAGMTEGIAAANSLRAKVQRAVKRGTGCRLTKAEAFILDFMEGDGDWWNEPRARQQSQPPQQPSSGDNQ